MFWAFQCYLHRQGSMQIACLDPTTTGPANLHMFSIQWLKQTRLTSNSWFNSDNITSDNWCWHAITVSPKWIFNRNHLSKVRNVLLHKIHRHSEDHINPSLNQTLWQSGLGDLRGGQYFYLQVFIKFLQTCRYMQTCLIYCMLII